MVRQRRILATAACALVLVAVAGLGACHRAGSAGGLSVRSALRTQRYTYTERRDFISATDSAQQVLLVIGVDGIVQQEFTAIPKDKVYVVADGTPHRMREVAHSTTADSSGRVVGGGVTLLAAVPRTALHFTLHLGDRPPVTFDADRTVLPNLESKR